MTGGRRLPLLFPFVALLLLLSVSCGGDDTATPTATGPAYAFGLDSQVMAGNGDANNVSAMEFAPDGRLFYAEQFTGDAGDQGVIRIILADGSLQEEPFATITVANHLGLDWGLTGLALDPDFETNHFVYAFYTAVVSPDVGKPTLIRFTEANGAGTEQTVISDDFPETFAVHAGYNANGDIHFGPDGYLYVSVGDYDLGAATPEQGGRPDLVNSLSTPIGKILRIDKADGSAAPDNPLAGQPDADPRVFAYGFREPFPFTFDASGNIYGTDNTPDTCEELNLIAAGQNYGWSDNWVFPFDNCAIGAGTQPVLNIAREGKNPSGFLSFAESQGISFLTDSTYEQLKDSLLVCQSEKSVVENTPSPGAIRQLLVTDSTHIASGPIVVNDCRGDVLAHEGVVYYANNTEIRKLIKGQPKPSAGATTQLAPPSLGS